ncbi:hypothetical protein KBI52_13050 [Microvirga sp. HBU67558]|uniref:hypothetical protein n=1 Tax=Microvirga sp. HBU67558 TaxID=2824562 RepID=UPI001B37A764|nr:hypothetical protein [Microvirga sp. HBU67558]MBQ0821135.1 hypothetical protein [Microvirga sp. HBU67558]
MAEFLRTSDSDRLVRGFLKLKDNEARLKVADLRLACIGEPGLSPGTWQTTNFPLKH